jgi:hypothetical protein
VRAAGFRSDHGGTVIVRMEGSALVEDDDREWVTGCEEGAFYYGRGGLMQWI